MADALISVVVEQLAPFLLDKLKKEVKLVLGAPEDVQELHDTFDKIRDVLDDAEKRHVKNVLLNLEKNEIKKAPESAWLERLKDVSYEMEDVLDEWCTKILKSENAVDGVDGARTGKKKQLVSFFLHTNLTLSLERNLYSDHTILLAIRNQSTMADALISVVVEQLAPFLLDKLKKEVKLVLGAPEAVKELHDTFDKIRDVLDDAEKRHVKNVLHNLKKNEIKVPESAWLEKLKDVSYEMEDVLDEWHTKILKLEIAADESSAPDGVEGARVSKKKEAILKDKEYLTHLSLRFNIEDDDEAVKNDDDEAVKSDDNDEALSLKSSRFDLLEALNNDDDDDEAVQSVIELLEPHPNLEKLRIWNYSGSKFPSWMEFPNWEGTSIRQLTILSCKNLKVLPALGRLEFLEDINLSGLDSVSAIMGLEVLGVLKNGDSSAAPVIAFPNLKKLTICEMKHWEEWVIKTTVNITLMPLLQRLFIYNCPMMKSLPCQILSSSSLREMSIKSCPHLEVSYLPLCLEKLTLQSDAGSLSISLPIQNGLHTNLKSLAIRNSPHSTLPQGLSQLKALQTLQISYCDSLTCMSNELQHLTSLQKLKIYGCPIVGPRCHKEVGEDWSIISYIPNIQIDREKIQ
ncbi:hypothetical protein GIB67_033608 [Kingdonia uniflora]|uniref:Rx N-terminal domain-containing protein n=1 Tax=Kingdonia uniflora TaxID=39325 RepID=A0A7J7LAQ6_9MAGN|nr:hypothetical protein GIB67_033608 [Kingdonia uniflora]